MTLRLSRKGLWTALVVMLLCQILLGLHQRMASRSAAIDVRVDTLPMELGPWKGRNGGELDPRAKDTLQLTHYVRRFYQHEDGRQVYVYVGYWNKQTGDHQAAKHSPSLCLPANGWMISVPKAKAVPSQTTPFEASTLVGQTKGVTQFFTYWFFSGEKIYREESHALLNMTREVLLHGRSDGGIIEISTVMKPVAEPGRAAAEAEATVDLFLKDFLPAVQAILMEPQLAEPRT